MSVYQVKLSGLGTRLNVGSEVEGSVNLTSRSWLNDWIDGNAFHEEKKHWQRTSVLNEDS